MNLCMYSVVGRHVVDDTDNFNYSYICIYDNGQCSITLRYTGIIMLHVSKSHLCVYWWIQLARGLYYKKLLYFIIMEHRTHKMSVFFKATLPRWDSTGCFDDGEKSYSDFCHMLKWHKNAILVLRAFEVRRLPEASQKKYRGLVARHNFLA